MQGAQMKNGPNITIASVALVAFEKAFVHEDQGPYEPFGGILGGKHEFELIVFDTLITDVSKGSYMKQVNIGALQRNQNKLL